MKKRISRKKQPDFFISWLLFCLLFFLIAVDFSYADVFKWIRIGRMWEAIMDSGDQSRPLGSNVQTYYNGARWAENRAYRVAVRDWTDEKGAVWLYKVSGDDCYGADELFDTMPIEVDDYTIKRYVRYQPPAIVIQGDNCEQLFPQAGDEVNPSYIDASGGKGADQMVESWIRLSVGITIHQKAFAFSQANHDDYIIFDWTFTNTSGPYTTPGGTQVDLPQQTLKDVYFGLDGWLYSGFYGATSWSTIYGEKPGDSLRIGYVYPAWWKDYAYDNLGHPNLEENGYLRQPYYAGWGVLHVDKSVDDASDDFNQPHVTGTGLQKFTTSAQHSQYDPSVCEVEYKSLSLGYPYIADGQKAFYFGLNITDAERVKHQSREDERKIKWVNSATAGRGAVYLGFGPYTMEPGDDFRIVFCSVGGGLSTEMCRKIGSEWLAGICTWDGEDKIPPVGLEYPDLIPTANDRAKDNWVATGKDSLHQNVYNAKWNVDHNYNIPVAPQAPSIEVWGRPDKVDVYWSSEAESAPDFAGYRVYRATGSPDSTFHLVYETYGKNIHSFEDNNVVRGFSYYYYVTAFDDGSMNHPGGEVGIKSGESVESGMYYNRTIQPVSMTRASGETLDDIRVVPNPYNIGAEKTQYPGEPDKIMFMELPPKCTINIFTQSGDLIKTLEHVDGSGDEPWDDLTTETRQIIVSGIYIAHIKTKTGEEGFVKFVIVR